MSIDEVLELEMEGSPSTLSPGEPTPLALTKAISSLQNSDDKYTRRSFRLLKVLTVLADGETFSRIRRFDPTEPVYPANIAELSALGLLEAVSLAETPQFLTRDSAKGDKKLIVPRQVRDHVRAQIPASEISEILLKAVELYFGEKWREGQVTQPPAAHSGTDFPGSNSGNPHTVVWRLLHDAVENNDDGQVKLALRLAESYCQRLINFDRYRNACDATNEILRLLESWREPVDDAWLNYTYGKSLRMLGRCTEAVEALELALSASGDREGNDFRTRVLLNLALAHETLGSKDEAMKAAKEVEELVAVDSAMYFEARRLMSTDLADLASLETRARSKGYEVAANNLAICLAVASASESVRWFRKVVNCRADIYNRMRASFQLISRLHERGELATATPTERSLLNRSYSYSYSQRVSGWFDSCHKALWNLLRFEGRAAELEQLYRHSSFLWRIYGNKAQEKVYLKQLMEENVAGSREVPASDRIKVYILRRAANLLGNLAAGG